MPKIALYWNHISQPSRAIKSLLEAGDVPYESHELDMLKGAHKAPEILAINPVGTLPFITVDGEPLYESAAILRYLAVKFPSLYQFYPEGAEHRAMIDAALDFNGTSLRPALMGVFVPIIFPRMMGGNEPDEATHTAAKESEEKSKGLLTMMNMAMEKRGHTFSGGNVINIADFQLYFQLVVITYHGKVPAEYLKDYPKVLAWYNTVGAHKGIKETHDCDAMRGIQAFASGLYAAPVEKK